MSERPHDAAVTIRPAQCTEKPLLVSMIRAGRLNPLGLDWRRFLVAELPSGQVVGCIQRKDHAGEVRELASLYVHPRWRKQGIARALVRELMQRTIPPLWLTCRQRLTGFYEHFGFKIVEFPTEMPAYFRAAWRLFRVIRFALPGRDGLAVMRCDPPSNQAAA
jgi:GNAT superfamily N-acetyltransferase